MYIIASLANRFLSFLSVLWLCTVVITVARWCSGRVSDSQSADCGFDSQLRHCRATTLGKLFTPMCLCLQSSISWYLARAFMSMRRLWQPWLKSDKQGEYCRSGSAAIRSLLDRFAKNRYINYLLYFLLYCVRQRAMSQHVT